MTDLIHLDRLTFRTDQMPVTSETVEPGVRVLTIDRTEKRNAFDIRMYEALAEAVSDADHDPDVRVVVITGRGGVFTSGNDLADFRDHPDSVAPFTLLRALVEAEKPIVAAVEGFAVGIGASMLLHCDLAFAGRSTVFALPFVKLGLSPEGASTLLLPRFAGIKTATELLMLGDKFDADRAESAGLISHLVADGQALSAARDSAMSLQALPAESVRITKRLLHRDKPDVLQAIDEESELFRQRTHSVEAKEAIARFLK
ncbi:enoyl-CoA hydratase-related protein [Mycobacterium sp. URHB0044]|uniref:enoyl-CoA hydratase-related protein n=1 Tax=Mycobacterium sp. URHB0044 TaxID=1380386 RepID=UPI001E4C23F6|nr:enoyl-CoA hydratase-related protein [Mycobacterium sp. URHB0044]